MINKKYYINVNRQNIGPLNYDDIKLKIQNGELNENSFIFIPGNKDWLHLIDIDEFKNLVKEVPVEDKKIWYVHKNKQNNGPYSKNDIIDLIYNGDFDYKDFAWKAGMESWMQVEQIEELVVLEHPSTSIVKIDNIEDEDLETSPEPKINLDLNIESASDANIKIELFEESEESVQQTSKAIEKIEDSEVSQDFFENNEEPAIETHNEQITESVEENFDNEQNKDDEDNKDEKINKSSKKLIPEFIFGILLVLTGVLQHFKSEKTGAFIILLGVCFLILFAVINKKKKRGITQNE